MQGVDTVFHCRMITQACDEEKDEDKGESITLRPRLREEESV